jgi:hypothetical protein
VSEWCCTGLFGPVFCYIFQQYAGLRQDNLKNPRIFLARECNEMRVAHGIEGLLREIYLKISRTMRSMI